MKDQEHYAGIGMGMEIVGPLLLASMEESKKIGDHLDKVNLQSAYRDGFEAGIREGLKRQQVLTREFLGVDNEFEPKFLGPSAYLREEIKTGKYPYNKLTEADLREDW
jgi:hypothetical protein